MAKIVEYHWEFVPSAYPMGIDNMDRLGKMGWHLGGIYPGRPGETSPDRVMFVYYFWREKEG